MTTETEKPLNEMSDEELLAVRNEIAAEEFGAKAAPAVSETIMPEPEPQPEPKPKPEPEPKEEDLTAGIPPALQEALDGLANKVAALDTFSNRLKQAESRLGSMQNDFYAAKKAADAVVKAPSQEEIEKAAQEEKDWEELRVEYPDWAKAMDARLMSESKKAEQAYEESISNMRRQIQSQFEERIQSQADKMDEMVEKKFLSFFHPGWKRTIESKDYQKWIAEQPKELQSKTFSMNASDAIEVLDAFNVFRGEKKSPAEIAAERKKRLQQSTVVEGTTTTPPKAEADMTDAEYREKYGQRLWAK
jgi:hypothetical protein